MDPINETNPAMAQPPAEPVVALSAALGVEPSALTAALLEALDRLGVAVSVKEVASGRYLHVSPVFAAAFGRPAADFARLTDVDLMPAPQAAAVRGGEQSALVHGAPPNEQRLERDGLRRDFTVARAALIAPGAEAARHLLSVWVESTAQRQREHQLQQALAQLEQQQLAAQEQRHELLDQSLRDSATGLYHRVHFDDQLRREVDLSSREHREFALVAIALDPLRAAAAALGAPARLRVLQTLGTLLRGNTRAMDASCLLEESRFAVLLSGVGLATAHSRMEGLRRQCATQIVVLDGRDIGFSVSMGIASFPHTAHTEDKLLEAAQSALVEAQRRGGNQLALASIRFEPRGEN